MPPIWNAVAWRGRWWRIAGGQHVHDHTHRRRPGQAVFQLELGARDVGQRLHVVVGERLPVDVVWIEGERLAIARAGAAAVSEPIFDVREVGEEPSAWTVASRLDGGRPGGVQVPGLELEHTGWLVIEQDRRPSGLIQLDGGAAQQHGAKSPRRGTSELHEQAWAFAGSHRVDLAKPAQQRMGDVELRGDRRIVGIATAEAGELATGVLHATFGERAARVLETKVPIAEQIELCSEHVSNLHPGADNGRTPRMRIQDRDGSDAGRSVDEQKMIEALLDRGPSVIVGNRVGTTLFNLPVYALGCDAAGWYGVVVSPAGIPEAIRRSMRILATHRALFGRPAHGRGATRTMSEIDIAGVIEVFEARRAGWVLVGAHAIGLITEPRATADFDFIVEGDKLGGILRELAKKFGELGEHDIGAAIQLQAIDVDLIRSTHHPLFEVALEQRRTVGDWKVPRTEVLVVLKFLAAVSPVRSRNKRIHDVGDIALVYQTAGGELDRAMMIELAGLVYPGAEREFGELLDKIDRGAPISI